MSTFAKLKPKPSSKLFKLKSLASIVWLAPLEVSSVIDDLPMKHSHLFPTTRSYRTTSKSAPSITSEKSPTYTNCLYIHISVCFCIVHTYMYLYMCVSWCIISFPFSFICCVCVWWLFGGGYEENEKAKYVSKEF